MREAYRATQIRAVICVPLQKGGTVRGGDGGASDVAAGLAPSEVELVTLVASRCWESIERTRVVRVLAESEQRLRLAVETGRLGVWELDLQTRALPLPPCAKRSTA